MLQALVDAGHTVAVIEHNLEIIKEADAIIDLGPEGGAGGGQLVAAGSPKELLKFTRVSHTAKCLKGYLTPGFEKGYTKTENPERRPMRRLTG